MKAALLEAELAPYVPLNRRVGFLGCVLQRPQLPPCQVDGKPLVRHLFGPFLGIVTVLPVIPFP